MKKLKSPLEGLAQPETIKLCIRDALAGNSAAAGRLRGMHRFYIVVKPEHPVVAFLKQVLERYNAGCA